MALTRKLLKGLGLTDEQIDSIIEAHTATVEGLQAQVRTLTEKANEAAAEHTELESLKAGDYKAKYEAVKKNLDDLKADIAGKETAARVEAAYRKRLEAQGIDAKRHDAIIRATNLKALKVNADGELDGVEEIDKKIGEEWGDFKVSSSVRGENVATPPKTAKATMTKAEILAIKDTAERQAAIAENHELFGF